MSKIKRRLFIIHHFDKQGRERAELLADILTLLTVEVVFGENFAGLRVSEGVQRRIAKAGLVVALLTRDVKVGEDIWQPSQWVIQEVTWAAAHRVPCLLVVEEGVRFDGLLGDLEQIRFTSDGFARTLRRIHDQVETMMRLTVGIPDDMPRSKLSQVQVLIIAARRSARRCRWGEVLRLSEEALLLDPTAWEAALNKGVALVYLGHLKSAEQVFLRALEDFPGGGDLLLSKANHNLGWVGDVRDAGRLDPKALRKMARHWERALSLDRRCVDTRASLVLCRAALDELDEANFLLMDSLIYPGFLQVLKREIAAKGAIGHRLLGKLPEWLYPVLFNQHIEEEYGEEYNEDENSDEDEE
jgi:tetratricopeptide (TPR) repeat protein